MDETGQLIPDETVSFVEAIVERVSLAEVDDWRIVETAESSMSSLRWKTLVIVAATS